MDFYLWYYTQLGPVGIPLALALLLAIYLGIKNYLRLYLLKRQFHRFAKHASKDANSQAQSSRNQLIRIFCETTRKRHESEEALRNEITYLFRKYLHSVKKDFSLLRFITITSPMLGLLGTVLGIIQVFDAIGHSASGFIPHAQLALGIGQALNTTVVGLVITIPTLAILFLLKNKLQTLAIDLTDCVLQAKNLNAQRP